MIIKENRCSGCAVGAYPCNHCSDNVDVRVCDVCGDDSETMFIYDGEDICESCLAERLLELGVIERCT
jgi:hypothetical protein